MHCGEFRVLPNFNSRVLFNPNALQYNYPVKMTNGHRDVHSYPTVWVQLKVSNHKARIQVGVMKRLP